MILMPENKKYFVKTNVIFFWHHAKREIQFFSGAKSAGNAKRLLNYIYKSIYYIFWHLWHHVYRTIVMFSFCPDIHIIRVTKVPNVISAGGMNFFLLPVPAGLLIFETVLLLL